MDRLHVICRTAFEINGRFGDPVLFGMGQDELLHTGHHGRLDNPFAQRRDKRTRSAIVLFGRDAVVPVDAHQHVAVSHLGKPFLVDVPEQEDQPRERNGIDGPHHAPTAEKPFENGIITARHTFERETFQPRSRTESRLAVVPPAVIDRNERNGHAIGNEERNGNRHRLIIEQCSGHAVDEDQRHENGTGRKDGGEHRREHLQRTARNGRRQTFAAQPARRDVIHYDNRVIDHHTDSQHQSRQRDDIDRDPHQIKDEHRNDQCDGNSQNDQYRRLEVAHEEKNDDTSQQRSDNDVVNEVRNRIVQQFGLVTRHRELHFGIIAPELLQLFVQLLLQFRHAGIGLLHYGQRHGTAAVRRNHALPFARMLHNPGKILELEKTSVDLQIDVFDIGTAACCRTELHAVLILSVTNREAAQRYIGAFYCSLDIGHRDSGLPQLRLIGNDQQFGRHATAQIDHRHLRKLLDTLCNDLRSETAQSGELIRHRMQIVPHDIGTLAANGQVDKKGRNIGCTRLDDLRAVQIARQLRNRAVDTFIDLDEEIIDVRPLLEGQTDNTAHLPRFAAHIDELRQLDELLPQRRQHRFVKLARRSSGSRNLNRNIGGIDIGNKRHGQQAAAYDAENGQNDRDHRHGDRAVEKFP